jgi:pSer/pThr/pTyr-binding forkhead associated (FHA) protein
MEFQQSEPNDSTERFNDDLLAQDSQGLNAEERDAVEALPSASALLIVQRGPNEGARFLLDQDLTTVGRHPNADIFLDDVTVSRRHAEFRRSGNQFLIEDLASLNGTYFDGVRIESALLDDGAEVQIGKFKFTFFASRADLGE